MNGRGQILFGAMRREIDVTEEIRAFLYGPSTRDQVEPALRAFGSSDFVARAHQCMNDQGASYIQQLNPDVAAIKAYLLAPFLASYVDAVGKPGFDSAVFNVHAARLLGAIASNRTPRVVSTPVLGIDLVGEPICIGDGLSLRSVTSAERARWAVDASIEDSSARDLLQARVAIDVGFESSWLPPVRDEVTRFVWNIEGIDSAFAKVDRSLAALRLATRRDLPIMFSETTILDLPWVRNRFFFRPSSSDIVRRFDNSPACTSVANLQPLLIDERSRFIGLNGALEDTWSELVVQRLVRIFNDDRNYINLYKCFELIHDDAKELIGGWLSARARRRFTHSANSPSAIGLLEARHAKEPTVPPALPMPLHEAHALMCNLIGKWLAAKIGSGRSQQTCGMKGGGLGAPTEIEAPTSRASSRRA